MPKAYAPTHGVVVPSHDAQALIAYLLSLKQPPLPGSADASTSESMNDTAAAAAPRSAPTSGAAGYDAAKGQALFIATCAACHQASGEGLPGAFPPLKGNAAVNDADPTLHIHVVLHGLQGANVGGIVYASPMPPFATTLSDADIAAIINYERSSWGNHGARVMAEQVAARACQGQLRRDSPCITI